jgi:hypothetical protein
LQLKRKMSVIFFPMKGILMNNSSRSTSALLLCLGLSAIVATANAIDMVGDNGVGERTTARIKQTLKDPFLTLLATSEFASKEDLQRRIKDAEESLTRFKAELNETPAPVTPAPMVQPTTPTPASMPAPMPTPEVQPVAPVAAPTPAPAPEAQPMTPPAPTAMPAPAPEAQPVTPMPTPAPMAEVQPAAPAPMPAPTEVQPAAPMPAPEAMPTPETTPATGAMATTPVQPTGSMVTPPAEPITPAEGLAAGVPPVGAPAGMPAA